MTSAILCGDTMRNSKQYLKWCRRQERGIRLVAPSDNLVKAYLEKSRNALGSMEVNAQADIEKWRGQGLLLADSTDYTMGFTDFCNMPKRLQHQSIVTRT